VTLYLLARNAGGRDDRPVCSGTSRVRRQWRAAAAAPRCRCGRRAFLRSIANNSATQPGIWPLPPSGIAASRQTLKSIADRHVVDAGAAALARRLAYVVTSIHV